MSPLTQINFRISKRTDVISVVSLIYPPGSDITIHPVTQDRELRGY